MKKGKKSQNRGAERVSNIRTSKEQTPSPVLRSLTTWQRAAIVLVLAGMMIAGLVRVSTRDPNISFFSRHNQAEWIVFPKAMDSSAHHVASLHTNFRREVLLNQQPKAARLDIRAAKRPELKINDAPVEFVRTSNWKDVVSIDVTGLLRAGSNQVEVKVINDTAPPALWAVLVSDQLSLPTDRSWEASCLGSSWRPAALASIPRLPGPGNSMGGGEGTFAALRNVWWLWLVFVGISIAICFGAYRWISRSPNLQASGTFSKDQVTLLLSVIAALWVVLFINNAILMPFLQGFDSHEHGQYIKFIQERHALPLASDGFEMFQPPLYYLISAAVLSLFGLSVDSQAGVLVLRLFTLVFGLGQFILVFLTVRSFFPGRVVAQLIGLLIAAFLPMQLYLSHYVTNETLAATMVTASVYLALRLLRTKNPSTSQFVWLGLCLGAAMLSKTTALLAVLPIFLAVIVNQVWPRKAIRTWLPPVTTMAAIFLATCGWHYLRVWRRFGNPLLGNWDAAAGFPWWQDPGFNTVGNYTRFGKSLVLPLFSGFWTFADGIYSTLWGDGLCGGVANLAFRPPWNYDLMAAGYLLALVPSLIILVGGAVALWRFIREPSAEWFVILGFAGAVLFGVIFMTLKVASYAQVKAFYGLAALVPICFFGVVGWETMTGGRRIAHGILGVLLLVWATNSFASYWIVRSADRDVFAGLRLGSEGKLEEAKGKALRAVETDPSSATARRFLSVVLSDSGQSAQALTEAQKAIELGPLDGACHLQLGMVLARQNQLEPAIDAVRRTIELAPENLSAFNLLIGCLSNLGRLDEAIGVARDALAQYPLEADLHQSLGVALAQKGDFVNATDHFVYALLFRPEMPQARSNLRLALRVIGKTPEGAKRLQEIAGLASDGAVILNEIAWYLATQPDAALRNGSEAVRLAEKASSLTGGAAPQMLATLAAAYAETGRFPEAIKLANDARLRAGSFGDTNTVALTEKLLSAFQGSRAYREEAAK